MVVPHIALLANQYRHFRDFVRRTESADGDQFFLDFGLPAIIPVSISAAL